MPTTDSAIWQYQDPMLQTWPKKGKIVVFDLEYTAWEGSMGRCWSEDWEHREIVQIGAVLVDAAADFEQLDTDGSGTLSADELSDLQARGFRKGGK